MEDAFWLLKAQRGLNFRPGTEYQYVNSNYALLALICERVSEQPFATFSQVRIFEPLGMTRSVINDSFFKLILARALGYYHEEDAWCNAPLTDSVVGPTNVYSCVEDLVRWDENLTTGAVGGKAVVERMTQPGQLDDGTELSYAYRLMVGPAHRHRGWQMVEHGGGQGGYGSWMVRFPACGLSVVVLFNHFLWNMQEYALKVADLFLEEKQASETAVQQEEAAPETASAVELSAAHLEEKVGTYFDARRAALREVNCIAGQLQFQGYDLVPLSDNAFFFEAEPQTRVRFACTEDGSVEAVKTITEFGDYTYERVERISPRPQALKQYAGRYYSPELDIYWTFFAEGDHLVAQRRKYVDSHLRPLFRDAFSDDWGPLMGYPTTYLVRFERDAGGAITGLRVSGTRVRNLRFVKERA